MRKLAMAIVLLAMVLGMTAPVIAQTCDYTLTKWALLKPNEERFDRICTRAYLPKIQWLEVAECEDPEGFEGFCQQTIDNMYTVMENCITFSTTWHYAFYETGYAEALRNSQCAKNLLWYWSQLPFSGWTPF